MALSARKIAAFVKTVVSMGARPSLKYPESAEAFDSSPEELRQAVNGIVDDLEATTEGASGADQIGAGKMYSTDTPGTLMSKLIALWNGLTGIVQNPLVIPPGSILETQLAFSVATQGELDTLSGEVSDHTGDADIHVAKDLTLQTGLNAQIVNGVYIRNNSGSLEWSADGVTWNAAGGLNGFEFDLPTF